MQKIVENGDRTTTVTLDGGECEVIFSQRYNVFAVSADSDITVALKSGKAAGDDGTMVCKAGESIMYPHMAQLDRVYLTGSGEVRVFASNVAVNPFKVQAKGGVTIDILMPPGRYASGSDNVILDLAGDMSDYALCVLTVSAHNAEMRENASNEDFQYLFSYNEQFSPYMITASNLSGIILKSDTLTSSQIQINKNGLGRYYSLIGIR